MLLSRITTPPASIFIIKPFCSYFKSVSIKNASSFFRYYYHTFTYTQAVSYVPDLFWCCVIISHFLPDRKKRKPYFYDLRLFTNFAGDLL